MEEEENGRGGGEKSRQQKKSNTEEGKKEGGDQGREGGGRKEKEWLLLLTEAVMGVGQKREAAVGRWWGEAAGPEARDREREVERDPHDDCFCGGGGEKGRGG